MDESRIDPNFRPMLFHPMKGFVEGHFIHNHNVRNEKGNRSGSASRTMDQYVSVFFQTAVEKFGYDFQMVQQITGW